jgi:hypothetical protein
MRRIRQRRGQRNFVGDWWMATTKRHVTFESWCERDHLIAFDFDPAIVEIASQPFEVEFATCDDIRHSHVPDYFLRTTNGAAIVVDIKPDKLITAGDRLNFAATAALGRQAGWAYRRLGEPPSVLSANLRWLAGYRHRRVRDPIIARHACDVVARSPGISLTELVDEVGEPILVLPTIFHLLWNHELVTELSRHMMALSTPIYLPGAP